tara:strand:+ start:112 stop:1131 length:1020 start_codon:yes stop_codon:yes gene_type:complete
VIEFFLLLIVLFLAGEILQKKKILLDNTDFSKHKIYIHSKKKIPITGGIFLLSSYICLNFNKLNLIYILLISSIFLIGLFSDLFKNFSPIRRLLIQIFITVIFISYTNISVANTRIDFVNNIFSNYKAISILFTLFCILVLINGTNFIDGINLSASGYYLIIFFSIFFLTTQYYINIDLSLLFNLTIITLAILIVNFLNKTQLGDGGAYLLAFLVGFLVIDFINNNKIVSPYYAISLFWYPCLENLFSIIRKIIINKKISDPDNYHLHHLIYLYLKKKKNLYINNLSGLIILFFNSMILLTSTYYFHDTEKQLIIIFSSIIIYIYSFYYLKKKLNIKIK